jgi:sec-independent protein translocase protein TatA
MDLGPWEIAIIAVVILVLFGSAKLPQAARSLGRSMRIFKSETKGLIGDDEEQQKAQPQPAREQAARTEPPPLPPATDEPISGVPVSKTEHGKQS